MDYVLPGKVNLVVIYISEAHARDEWPLSNKFQIHQHKTVEERMKAAQKYIDTFNPIYEKNIYVDSMIGKDFNDSTEENNINFEKAYSIWPERGYIIRKDLTVEYVALARIEDLVRWPEEIGNWLNKNL